VAATAACVFLAALCALARAGTLPLAVPLIYIAASAVTFIVYAADKAAAKGGQWRTRERTLHALAAIGGWPGALIAHTVLRHKSRKPSFQTLFRATVALNCAALAWWWWWWWASR
jgi:uncharacterized membrane protein YsdA (DUF1294 family)